jgi:membrane-bound lytic murein transglycosylase D
VRTGPVEIVQPPVSTFTPDAASVPTTVATGVPSRTDQPRVHRVDRGDTLVSIARRYQCDTGKLARANGLDAPRYAIRQGQRLKLEGCAN